MKFTESGGQICVKEAKSSFRSQVRPQRPSLASESLSLTLIFDAKLKNTIFYRETLKYGIYSHEIFKYGT